MAKAWVYQDDKQVKKHGAEKASWYVGWIDPNGRRKCKSCGPGSRGKRIAEKEAEKIAAELTLDVYEDRSKATWKEFREQLKELVLDGMGDSHRKEAELTLGHFERLLKPKRIATVSSTDIAMYVSRRRKDAGVHRNSTVSVCTINKELRYLRAIFRKAKRHEFLVAVPEFDFLKEPKKIPTWISPDEFGKLYQHCDAATRPNHLPYPPATWWRGLLVFGYMTGWRIGSILALRREDVDLDNATALSRAEDNKGGRDQSISLNPLVVEHLRQMPSFEPMFFPVNTSIRQLYETFHGIQEAAGVRPSRGKERYGFHDLRRAFATLNAGRLAGDVLQALMQHKSYATTQRYIDIASHIRPAAHNVYVPDLPGRGPNGGTVEGRG